jgi:Zn-dependent protease
VLVQKETPYEYTVSYVPFEPERKVRFSIKEIQHLAVASVLVIAVGLSIAMFFPMDPSYLALFTIILFASFMTHEMAHKIAAQKRGFWAEFRLTLIGAVLTLISAISPIFKIISPGAVMISGVFDKKNIGKISIAGPMTNLLFSITFLAAALMFPQYTVITLILMLGAAFNAWIALFNLIPFGMLDGFKIFLWNKAVWAAAFTASLVLTFASYQIINLNTGII